MQFLYQPLTWGFLLVGVPILVHLINMLRHRKVHWAAMDFLLESYRRNRRWVMLKQWLLLAARILTVVLLVAMLAKWVSSSRWLGLLGGQSTHHYVLLDDSYSMADIEQGETAYNRGLRALSGLVRSIAGEPGQHQITLLRWSRAALAARGGEDARIDAAADLIAQTVPRDPTRLLDRLNATQPTALQLSPEESLDLITSMITENNDEQAEVYLLSDLRRNEFGEPEVLGNKLRALAEASAGLHLIDCARDSTGNLSLVNLEPEQEVWAAGVPLMVRFQVRNQSAQAIRNVVVKVRSISYAEGVTTPRVDSSYSGEMMELPPVVIEQIEAGETLTRQVQVVFASPGKHVVEAALPEDPLPTDNKRWCVIGIREAQRVLLVDGQADQSNAFYFETVLTPDARLQTGMAAEKVDAAFLRDVLPETLAEYDVVALLDVPRLEPQAVEKLEEFCRSGGGIFVTGGPNTNLQFVNEQLYRAGDGFYPVELARVEQVQVAADVVEPQVKATDHPILAPLTQLSASPFFLLRIRQQIIPSPESLQRAAVEPVALGPGNTPLIVDQSFGNGRVVALLTGLTPEWSNWAQDPTFVVLALRTFGYLGSFRRAATSEPIGSPIEMVVSGDTVLPEAEIILPTRDDAMRMRLLRNVESDNSAGQLSRIALDLKLQELDRDLIDALLRPGVFEAWMVNTQGENLFQNFVHNVAAAEGDLQRVDYGELERKLPDIALDIRTAEAVSGSGLNTPEAAHSTLLMGLLASLLLIEQLLAYSASYHAPRVSRAAGAVR